VDQTDGGENRVLEKQDDEQSDQPTEKIEGGNGFEIGRFEQRPELVKSRSGAKIGFRHDFVKKDKSSLVGGK
jgi:hypothetical protein